MDEPLLREGRGDARAGGCAPELAENREPGRPAFELAGNRVCASASPGTDVPGDDASGCCEGRRQGAAMKFGMPPTIVPGSNSSMYMRLSFTLWTVAVLLS